MTKIWGPLGWATLHSIAALYPDSPTDLEQMMIARWFDAFANTLACSTCMKHFKKMFADYIRSYPQWNTSRKELSLFVLRAHNTVNARNNVATYTAAESFNLLRANVDPSKAESMRQSYIMFIRRDWARDTTMSGISVVKYIKDIVLTETDYWAQRSFTWDEIETLVGTDSVSSIVNTLPPPVTIQSIGQQYSLFRRSGGPKLRLSFLSR